MDYKVVVSDSKTGKSYTVEVKEQAKKIRGKKIGDSLDGAILGLPGYKLEITGGSDKGGFSMKKGVHGSRAMRALLGKGVGYKAESGSRARRRVHGEEIGEDIVQVNTRITDYGSKSVEELLGLAAAVGDDSAGEPAGGGEAKTGG